MLALTLRLFDTVTAFRAGSWAAHQPAGGSPHGEIFGKTIGIVGYGRIGREVAQRAVPFGCKVIAANRSPVADKGDASEIYPLAELDHMLPQCDVVLIAAGLGDGDARADRRPPAGADEADRAADQYRPRRDRRRGGAVRGAARQPARRRRARRLVAALVARSSPTGARRASRFTSCRTC